MPKSLIVNSPYFAPSQHWKFVEEGATPDEPKLVNGRREAGYMIADPKAKPHQDRGIFVPLPLVNQIRPRVDKWRAAGYPGVTGITKALLDYWNDHEQHHDPRLFFCQIEAIETLIWLSEAPDAERTGINIPTDGGDFRRLCTKLATGTGKTVVMAMLIAWQAINRATYPRDGRFSQHIFVVAPNLTVRGRLSVLLPASEHNYYDKFGIVPISMRERLYQAKVLIRNWHALSWESAEKIKQKKGVDKRGAKSDYVYTREVLGDLANAHNIVVINDEAHHAWRVPAGQSTRGLSKEAKEDLDEATIWVGGLDRIHRTRGISNCFDFSATPFAPSGKKNTEESLFGWIVSDFGLNDAIEAGLVKTPWIVVRTDALPDTRTYKPHLQHIYNDQEVKDNLNRKAEPHVRLPNLVTRAYAWLGTDWKKIKSEWDQSKMTTPPVMITVANRTETAARIKHAFKTDTISQGISIEPLCDPAGILHIDSQVLKRAEAGDQGQTQGGTQKEQANSLREKVNTVGQEDKPGEKIQNVISVGMLSEGWDARTVTHIMGLRAFTSQLLCEQVVGRGLRRASYEINEKTGLFDAEYVNVFGVPFSFLPHAFLSHEEEKKKDPSGSSYKVKIQAVDEKKQFAITWPNVIRIDSPLKPELRIVRVDWNTVEKLPLDTAEMATTIEIAPTIDNKPVRSKGDRINPEDVRIKRKQTLIFKLAQSVWSDWKKENRAGNKRKPGEPAPKEVPMAELVRLAEQFLDSDRIQVKPKLYNSDPEKKRRIIALSMSKVTQHFWLIWKAIEFKHTEKTALVLNSYHPLSTTGDMSEWWTGKPCKPTKKSHINYCVYDSTWEDSAAFKLDHNEAVKAWVKNDHLGFEVPYFFNGEIKKYRPDFLIHLQSGGTLVLETKGQQTEQDKTKHAYMRNWVEAVTDDGRFGRWQFAVSRTPSDIKDILATAVS